jgi:hypothetical protein
MNAIAAGVVGLAVAALAPVARADPPRAAARPQRPVRWSAARVQFVVETGTETTGVRSGRVPGSMVFMQTTPFAWTLRAGIRISFLRVLQASLRAGFTGPLDLGIDPPVDPCGNDTLIGTQVDRGGTAYSVHVEGELRLRFVPRSPFYIAGGARFDRVSLRSPGAQSFPCERRSGGFVRDVTLRTSDETRTRAGGPLALGLMLGRRDRFDFRVGAALQGDAAALTVTVGWAPW